MTTSLTVKGQVTIPKAMRDVLGITAGSRVAFDLAPDGRVVLRRADPEGAAPSRFARLRGTATAGMSTEEIMALSRGDD